MIVFNVSVAIDQLIAIVMNERNAFLFIIVVNVFTYMQNTSVRFTKSLMNLHDLFNAINLHPFDWYVDTRWFMLEIA